MLDVIYLDFPPFLEQKRSVALNIYLMRYSWKYSNIWKVAASLERFQI